MLQMKKRISSVGNVVKIFKTICLPPLPKAKSLHDRKIEILQNEKNEN